MNPNHDDQSYLDELDLHQDKPDVRVTREPDVILNRINQYGHTCRPDPDGVCYDCRLECGR